MSEERVTFGELGRIVQRIDERTLGMAKLLPDLDKRVTVLEIIHPNRAHDLPSPGKNGGSFGRWLAVIGTIVFSAVAGIAAAITNVSGGGPR